MGYNVSEGRAASKKAKQPHEITIIVLKQPAKTTPAAEGEPAAG
jgi:hypothetical protein